MILTEYDEEFVHKGWYEDGLEKGRSEGLLQMYALIEKLLEEGKTDDVKRIGSDPDYRDKLLKEYKI